MTVYYKLEGSEKEAKIVLNSKDTIEFHESEVCRAGASTKFQHSYMQRFEI